MRTLARATLLLLGSLPVGACGADVVAAGGGGTTTASTTSTATACPAPTPGQCAPGACVGGVKRTGQASCVDGAWVCEEVACGGTGGAGGAGGGCAGKVLSASDYDTSCSADEDCAPIFAGDTCGHCFCENAAIAKSALPAYEADVAAAQFGPSVCDCAERPPPVCEEGTCVMP